MFLKEHLGRTNRQESRWKVRNCADEKNGLL